MTLPLILNEIIPTIIGAFDGFISSIKDTLFNTSKIEFYTTWAIVLSALIMIAIERIRPYKKQALFRNGFFNDFVLYTFVQSYVLSLAFAAFVGFLDSSGIFKRSTVLSETPIAYIVLTSLFFHDFYIYWFHRWMHNNKYLWRLHEAHHSTTDVDWLSGSRSHALEILINQSIEFAPLILLGAPKEAIIIKGAIDAIWGMYIHCNIDLKMGWLQYIINGPELHRWHHADKDPEAYNMNFATKFGFWDFIFKTNYYPQNKVVQYYGISNPFPNNYFMQQLFAFRKK